MSEESWKHKPFGQLSPEERQLAARELAITIEDSLKKAGYSSFQHFYESLQSFAKQFATTFFVGIKLFQDSYKLMKYPISTLGKYGWYISPSMTNTETIEIAKLLSTNHIADADQKMVRLFETELKIIEKSICKRFPDRSKLIKSAFNAHRRKEFELSIPVMIAQVDGICNALIGTQFFAKRDGIPITSKFAEQFASDIFFSSVLEPLLHNSIVSANTWDLPEIVGLLNRHGILHGTILDYATQVNSCKLISMLQYITEFVSAAVKAKPPNQALKLTVAS